MDNINNNLPLSNIIIIAHRMILFSLDKTLFMDSFMITHNPNKICGLAIILQYLYGHFI